jgi:hypothetical protein
MANKTRNLFTIYSAGGYETGVKEFDITGRAMKGWVMVGPAGIEDDNQLSGWIQRAVKFVGKMPAK